MRANRLLANTTIYSSKKSSSVYVDHIQRALFIGAAICFIVGDNRFWMSISTWANGMGSVVGTFAILLAGAFLLINLIREKTPLLAAYLLPVFAYLLLICVWGRFGLGGSSIAARSIALAFPIYAILCLRRNDKIKLLYSISVVFAVALGLSAVFFILKYLNISFPSFTLESSNPLKIAQGFQYEISIFGGSLLNRYGNLGYCGVFDEAGCVGTFVGLLFIALNECGSLEKYPYIRLIKVAILVEGALSFSFAFVLMMFAYLAFCLLRRGDLKITAILIVTILAIVFLMVADFQQLGNFASLKTRVESLFSGGGVSNNRVNEQTAMIMHDFYHTNDIAISLFGYGQSAFAAMASKGMVDGASVEFYLYDYGYVGVALYYFIIVLLNRCSGRSIIGCWLPLLFFLISTYQRPEVMTSLYLAILMLGFIPSREKEAKFDRSELLPEGFGWLDGQFYEKTDEVNTCK